MTTQPPLVGTSARTGISAQETSGPETSRTGTAHVGSTSRTGPVRATPRARLRRFAGLVGMQSPGWALLAVVVLLAVVGGLLGWLELRVMAVLGVVVLLCAVAFTLGRQTYAVTLRMQRHQVVVGERALGDLIVQNTSSRRLLPARIELPVGRRVASFGLPSLAGRASHDEVFAVPTSRRAVIRVGPARSVRGDPFGLMGREVRWTEAIDLYVHPRTVPIPGRTGGFIRDLEGYTTTQLTNSDVSFHALREYVAGDDRRYVHWKSSARAGQLMVRQFEETRRSHVAIALDLDRTDYSAPEEFELAVSITGSLAVQALRDENEVAVLTSSGRLRAVNAKRTLDELCTVEAGHPSGSGRGQGRGRAGRAGARDSVTRLAREVQYAERNASLVSLVTGAHPTAAVLRQVGATFDTDVRVLVVRVDLGAELAVQSIGAVSVVTVGQLADLPRAVRRASIVSTGGTTGGGS